MALAAVFKEAKSFLLQTAFKSVSGFPEPNRSKMVSSSSLDG